jgi:hypothetical protein
MFYKVRLLHIRMKQTDNILCVHLRQINQNALLYLIGTSVGPVLGGILGNQTIRTLAAEQIEKTIDIIFNHSRKYRRLTPSSSYQPRFSVRDSSNR